MQTVTIQRQGYLMPFEEGATKPAKDPEAVKLGVWLEAARRSADLNRPDLVKKAQISRPDARISQDYLSKLEYGTRSLAKATKAVREALRLALGLTPDEWEEQTGLRVPSSGEEDTSRLTGKDHDAIARVVGLVLNDKFKVYGPDNVPLEFDTPTPKPRKPIPDSLKQAAEIHGARFPDLRTSEWQDYLNSFRNRGAKTDDPDEWLSLYKELARQGVVPGED